MDSRFSFLAIYFLFINCQAKRSSQTETFYGEVGASNYTYYRFDGEKEMKLILTLTTVQGDADLYVGGQRSKPTFDLDQHHFQSTTCGRVDEVVVPASFVRDERPIGIGIYGEMRLICNLFYRLSYHRSSKSCDIKIHLRCDSRRSGDR